MSDTPIHHGRGSLVGKQIKKKIRPLLALGAEQHSRITHGHAYCEHDQCSCRLVAIAPSCHVGSRSKSGHFCVLRTSVLCAHSAQVSRTRRHRVPPEPRSRPVRLSEISYSSPFECSCSVGF